MRVRLDIVIPDEHVQMWIDDAYKSGFCFKDPHTRLLPSEQKEAIRYAIQQIITLHIESKVPHD